MKRGIVWLIVLLSIGSVQAQLKSQAEKQPVDVRGGITTPVTSSLFGLFSPGRFYMSQSYGLTYYSGGGQSGTVGMYTNQMNFKLSDPLFLRVNMGIMHQPFGGPKGVENKNAQFLHGAELIYKPNSKFQMNIGYSTSPYYSGFGMYESPFGSPNRPGYTDYQFGGNK